MQGVLVQKAGNANKKQAKNKEKVAATDQTSNKERKALIRIQSLKLDSKAQKSVLKSFLL